MSRNVQLGAKERCRVYLEADSRRILGFGPEYGYPFVPPGIKVIGHTCYTAREIENYAHMYRDQCRRDDEDATEAQMAREAPMRAACRDAILQRNRELSSDTGNPHAAKNIALNLMLLRVQDELYANMQKRRMARVATIAAERYEEGKLATDVALESPLVSLK